MNITKESIFTKATVTRITNQKTADFHNDGLPSEFFGIDLLKFLMAVIVVAIHTHPLESITDETILSFYHYVIYMAVPFFFTASGFLIAFRLEKTGSASYLGHRILKLVKTYLLWTIIYLPVTVYGWSTETLPLRAQILKFGRNVLFRGENFFSYPLWYLLSLIYGLLLLYLFKKMRWLNLFSLSLIAGITLGLYYYLPNWILEISQLSGWTHRMVYLYAMTFGQARMVSGAGYLALGMLLQRGFFWFKKSPAWSFLLIFVVSVFAGAPANSFVFSLVAVISLVMLAACTGLKGKPSLFLNLRYSSMIIYYIHMLVFFPFYLIKGPEQAYGFYGFLFTLTGSLLLAALILHSSFRKTRFYSVLFG